MAKGTTRLRRTFTPQFKKDAVRLVVEEGKSLTEVSAHLGIARSLLQRWREQLSSKPAPEVFPGHGRVTGTMPLLRASSTRSRPNGFTTSRSIRGPRLAATSSTTSRASTIAVACTPRSATALRKNMKPTSLNRVSTFPGEDHSAPSRS